MRKFYVFVFFVVFGSGFIHSQSQIIRAIIDSVNIDSLMFRVEEISGERGVFILGEEDTIYSRNRNRPGNEICFRYIREKLYSYGLQVDSGSFGMTGGKNIWGVLPGYVYFNEPVILCAHYDGMPNQAIAPAADDDGSGVAALLEAARVITQGGYQFEHPIIFAFWDEEEYGLAGSTNYAQLANAANDTIHGVINMDAIAHDSDNDSVARVHTRPTGNSEIIADTVVAVNMDYAIGLDLLVNNPGATYSDHASFWNNGYGAVLMIQDWDNDANPHYHTVTDKIDYFNVPYFHKMARLSIASAAAFAVPYAIGTAGVDEENESTRVILYPNPASETVNLKWWGEFERITISNLLGSVIYSNILLPGTNSTTVELGNFDTGIYFVELSGPKRSHTIKMVIR